MKDIKTAKQFYKLFTDKELTVLSIEQKMQLYAEYYHKSKVESIKVCIGCGHRSDIPIRKTSLACCPDSSYIPLNDYLKGSIYPSKQF